MRSKIGRRTCFVHMISVVVLATFCTYWRLASAAGKQKRAKKARHTKPVPSAFSKESHAGGHKDVNTQPDTAASVNPPMLTTGEVVHCQVDCTGREDLPAEACEDAPEIPSGFKEIVSVELACDTASFFRRVLSSKTNFIVDQHVAIGQHDFVRSPWTKDEDGKTLTRIFHFTTPLNQPMGPKEARCQQTHYCNLYSNKVLVYRTKQRTLDIPFSNDFTVETYWMVSPSANSSPSSPLTQLTISVAVPFTAFNLFKGIIERTSYSECRSFHQALAEEARSMFVKLSADSSGLRRALTIVEHAATVGVERALTAQKRGNEQEGPSIISGKTPPTCQVHATGEPPSWVGQGTARLIPAMLLAVVIMLQLLQLRHSWSLEQKMGTCVCPNPDT